MRTPRGKMNLYMNSLKIRVGYSSLKAKHLDLQSRNFPSLKGSATGSNMEEDSEEVDPLYPTNPIEEKDRQIATLQVEMAALNAKAADTKKLEESLANASAELAAAKKDCQISRKKLEFTQKATEQSLIEGITNPEGFRPDEILIGVYSATLDEDQISFEEKDEEEPETRSRKDLFLSMKSKLNMENQTESDRFKEVTNLILEKVKHTQHSRLRSRSISGGLKRSRSKEGDGHERSSTRPRTSAIPVKQ